MTVWTLENITLNSTTSSSRRHITLWAFKYFSFQRQVPFKYLLFTLPFQIGGEYAYVRECFGPLPAFLILWMNLVLLTPATVAASACIFATYVLKPAFPSCEFIEIQMRGSKVKRGGLRRKSPDVSSWESFYGELGKIYEVGRAIKAGIYIRFELAFVSAHSVAVVLSFI